jgi:hypothetical protein
MTSCPLNPIEVATKVLEPFVCPVPMHCDQTALIQIEMLQHVSGPILAVDVRVLNGDLRTLKSPRYRPNSLGVIKIDTKNDRRLRPIVPRSFFSAT